MINDMDVDYVDVIASVSANAFAVIISSLGCFANF